MLFESANQFQNFLLFLLSGVLVGVIHTLFFVVRTMFKNQKVITFVCDFAFVAIAFLAFAFSCHLVILGEFRLYALCAFLLGFVAYLGTVEKMVAKFVIWVYNIFSKLWNKFKSTKTFKVIFK